MWLNRDRRLRHIVESHAGGDAEPIEQVEQIFGREVARCAGCVWASAKSAGRCIKGGHASRKPGLNESYYGFRSFNGLLEEAQSRGLLDLERDEKSGGYIVRVTPE